MGSIEGANSNPTHFRFRKETVHVEYTNSSEGTWTTSYLPISNYPVMIGLGLDSVGITNPYQRWHKSTG